MHIYIYTYIHIYTYTYIHIYIYIYTHIHIYIYTDIHIYIYTYIHIYIYTYIHIYIYTYIHIYRYTYIQIYRYTYMHIYIYTYIHIYIYTYIHIYIYTYIHIYTYTYIHVYIYTYSCICILLIGFAEIFLHVDFQVGPTLSTAQRAGRKSQRSEAQWGAVETITPENNWSYSYSIWDFIWDFMGFHWFLWDFMRFWFSWDFLGFFWVFVDFQGISWNLVGGEWDISLGSAGISWKLGIARYSQDDFTCQRWGIEPIWGPYLMVSGEICLSTEFTSSLHFHAGNLLMWGWEPGFPVDFRFKPSIFESLHGFFCVANLP